MIVSVLFLSVFILEFSSCSNDSVDSSSHCWEITEIITSDISSTWYYWGTENVAKALVKSAGNGSYYRRVSVNDEYSCDALNDNDNPSGGTSKPSTPTGLTASASSSSVELSWNRVSGATSYNVYRATSASGTYSYKTSTSSTSYTDYSVNEGSTYYYKVSAENSAGESSKSSYVSATVGSSGGGGDAVPAAPTGVTATQQGPKAYPYVYISWDYSWDADHYVIYRSTSQSGSFSKIGSTSSFSYADENVSNGKTYYYKVKAANSSGKESAFSNVASVTVNTTIVETPGILTCSVSKGYNQITISWTYASSSGYSAPDEVRMLSADPTWTGLTDVFSWTTASSKKSHTVRASELIYNGNNKEEYTLYLQVRNSAGNGVGAKIVWNVITNTGYVLGNLCGMTQF